jgi:thiol-disulfide isomerase/thioredoxin
MKRNRWIGAGLIAAGLLALIAGLLWRQGTEGDTRAARLDGATLLALALPDLQGKDQPLAQWKGKVLVVNFWATWCEPCREEMPRFMKLQEEQGANGLQFVGIAIDQPDKVRQFATEIQLNYPALIGGYGAIELSKSFGNQFGALPFTVVMDRAGSIVHTQLGPLKDAQLRSIIRQLI